MNITDHSATTTPPKAAQLGLSARMLSLATIGFLLNFWACCTCRRSSSPSWWRSRWWWARWVASRWAH